MLFCDAHTSLDYWSWIKHSYCVFSILCQIFLYNVGGKMEEKKFLEGNLKKRNPVDRLKKAIAAASWFEALSFCLPLYVCCVQVCNNEATCTCDTTWAGTDCSMPDPPKEPDVTPEEEPKGRFPTFLLPPSAIQKWIYPPFFNLAQIHIDRMFNVNVITVSLSVALLDLSQSHIPEFHRSTGEHKGFDCRRM